MKEKKGGMVKRALIVSLGVIAMLAAVYLIGTGFVKISSPYVWEYTVSEDGTSMEIKAAVATSMGYIRDVKVKSKGADVYLTFYAAFGGLNSSLGAKNTFDIPLDADSSQIYIYRGSEYQLILQKNAETGEWQRMDGR